MTTTASELEFGQSPETKLTPIDTLIGVIIRPQRTFERMREAHRGHWWVVAILAVTGLLLVTLISLPIQQAMVQQRMEAQLEAQREQLDELPADQQAQIEQQQAMFTSQSTLAILGIVSGLVGIAVSYLVRAAILFALGLVLGGRAGFGQVFRMGVWTTLPGVVRNFVAAIAVLVTGELPAQGLSAIYSAEEAAELSPVLLALLTGIDVYTVWAIFLITVGVSATYQISKVKSLFIAVVFWLLGVGLTVGMAALGQMFASMAPGA